MADEVKNSLVEMDDVEGIAGQLTGKAKAPYTSLPMETDADRIKVYNLTSDPDYRLRDYVGKIINLKDVYAEEVELMSEATGVMEFVPRIILIDDKGLSYVSVSKGVFGSLKKMFGLIGLPHTWKKPIKVEVKQIAKDKKVTLTLAIVE